MTDSDKIDAYIEAAESFARPILRHVRALVHQALPEAEEAVKWGMPYFTVGGKNAVGMASFKRHASVIICSDERAGGGMGNFGKLASLDELPSDQELIARFRESAEAVQSSKAARPSPKPAMGTPDDLAAAIAKTPGAQKVYDGFTDAQRRDYVDWITSAKRKATREKRMAEAAQWIGEGKRRNWKYEKC